MKTLFVILIGFFPLHLICCDCKTISKENNYIISDFVFLGEIIDINDSCFKVKVQETFKGKLSDTVNVSIDNCSISPNINEIWLLYAISNYNSEIYISKCSWSRSFRNPFCIYTENFSEPPPIDASNVFLSFFNSFNVNIALSELHYDVLNLRYNKVQHYFKNNLSLIHLKLNRQVILLYLITLFSVIIIIVQVIKFFNK